MQTGKRLRQLKKLITKTTGLYFARYKPNYRYVDKNVVSTFNRREDSPDYQRFLPIAKDVIETKKTLLDYDRLYIIWQVIRNVYKLRLASAEVGSFKGGSAYFIANSYKNLSGEDYVLHIFDTFLGHPEKINIRFDSYHRVGLFHETDYDTVKNYLSPFPKVYIHKGEFSETVKELPEIQFGFVHIDVDIYQSTLDCLNYFDSRMAIGGMFVVDDYSSAKCPGVSQAVAEYLADKDHLQPWQMMTEQLVLIKTKERH